MKINKERMPFNSYEKKKKYDIKDDVVIIEKNNAILKVIVAILKIMIYTILLSLAFIGLVSIIIPETRDVLIHQAVSVFDEFMGLIGR